MTHGDKAKAKSAKAKASGKDASSKKDVAKSSKGVDQGGQAAKGGSKKDSIPKAADVSKKGSAPKADNGKGKGRSAVPAPGGFTNPVVAEAFRRAVKKYPSAFRRLTD